MNFDSTRAVVVFPGQLSREVSMRELLEEWSPQLLETLSAALGTDDPTSETRASLAAEQAVTVGCCLAAWHARGRPTPRYLLGHSLGELTALAAARSISEDDAVRLAAIRGDLMERACEASGGCGMMAVRAPLFDVEAIADACDVTVALHNAPRQLVVAGTREALERARDEFAEAGIRCTDLDQSGAFNCPLMESAVAPFRAALEECEVRPPQAIVYSASTCRPLIDARAELAHNLVAPVRWWETLARLAMEGIDTFLEISVDGLISPLPAGIVTERAARPSAEPAPRLAPVPEPAPATPGEADPAGEAVFAYFDDENRLHFLI
jgi:[acyl-carrier-protein] S-malonyltransferase